MKLRSAKPSTDTQSGTVPETAAQDLPTEVLKRGRKKNG